MSDPDFNMADESISNSPARGGGKAKTLTILATAAAVAVGGLVAFSFIGRSPKRAGATPSVEQSTDATKSKTLFPPQRPDVSYMSHSNRAIVTKALVTLARLSPKQTRLLQSALHFKGKEIFGGLKATFAPSEVLAAVASHTGSPAAVSPSVVFTFKSGAMLTLTEEEADVRDKSGNEISFMGTEPLDHQGHLTKAQAEEVVRSFGSRLGFTLTPQQTNFLRSYLTTRGALLDPNEDVMEATSNVIVIGHDQLTDPKRVRLEFYNGSILELLPDGQPAYQYLPWAGN